MQADIEQRLRALRIIIAGKEGDLSVRDMKQLIGMTMGVTEAGGLRLAPEL